MKDGSLYRYQIKWWRLFHN